MRLGVILPSTNPDGSAFTGAALIAQAQTIERVGFESLGRVEGFPLSHSVLYPLSQRV